MLNSFDCRVELTINSQTNHKICHKKPCFTGVDETALHGTHFLGLSYCVYTPVIFPRPVIHYTPVTFPRLVILYTPVTFPRLVILYTLVTFSRLVLLCIPLSHFLGLSYCIPLSHVHTVPKPLKLKGI